MIATFYSYKGGVGRSMALANVANWLRLQGLRVLVVDWDLEAPGIEAFFTSSTEVQEKVRASPGVADLVAGYIRKHPGLPQAFFKNNDGEEPTSFKARRVKLLAELLPSVESLAIELRPEAQMAESSLPVWLLSPGVREGAHAQHYARFIQRLDWTSLYEKHDGDVFFAWLRGEMERFDITLVDSRTGITEVGGVCTRELADLVVELCAPNSQNLKGCAMIARSLMTGQLEADREGRPLRVAIVPTRYENAESERLNEFEKDFKAAILSLAVTDGPAAINPDEMWNLKLQYIARYAYGETMCVNTTGRVEDLEKQYQKLGRFVASALLQRLPDSRVAALSARSEELLALSARKFSLNERMEQAFLSLPPPRQKAAQPLLLRLITFSIPGDPQSFVAAGQPWVRFDDNQRLLLEELRILGIVRIEDLSAGKEGESQGRVVTLAEPGGIAEWRRLREWIQDDISFLFWRYGMNATIASYEHKGREATAALLQGVELTQANKWITSRPSDFDQVEIAVVKRSRRVLWTGRAFLLATILGAGAVVAGALWQDENNKALLGKAELMTREARAIADANPQGALDLITQAVATTKPPREAYVLRASLHLKAQRPKEAYDSAEQALKIEPKDPITLRLRAQAAMQLGSQAEALESYTLALDLLKSDPTLWYERALVYGDSGQSLQAIADYGRAIELKPDYWDAIYNRALEYKATGKLDLAVADLRRVAAPDTDPILQSFASARLRELGRSTETTLETVKQRLFIHYVSASDKDVVTSLADSLRPLGVQSIQLVNRPTRGDVRYFFSDDRMYAQRVKFKTEEYLREKSGTRVELELIPLEGGKVFNAKPGTVELWLAPLVRPAAAR